jgi:translation elongation factor EF-4
MAACERVDKTAVAMCAERSSAQQDIRYYPTPEHVVVTDELALAEVILDFRDRLEGVSPSYAWPPNASAIAPTTPSSSTSSSTASHSMR